MPCFYRDETVVRQLLTVVIYATRTPSPVDANSLLYLVKVNVSYQQNIILTKKLNCARDENGSIAKKAIIQRE